MTNYPIGPHRNQIGPHRTQFDPIGPLRTVLEHTKPHVIGCLLLYQLCVQCLDITMCKATNQIFQMPSAVKNKSLKCLLKITTIQYKNYY